MSERAKIIGRSIKAARERRGLTQDELAGAIHVSLGTVSRWERGLHLERSYVRNMRALAEVLGIDMAELRAIHDDGLDERLRLLEAKVSAIINWIQDGATDGARPIGATLAQEMEQLLRDAQRPNPSVPSSVDAGAQTD